ncbi:MAG: PDZ domain-containing protein [Limnohabitans sp.]|nr:PDZ domain-containing protein [Limnohabitans sp.]
MNVRAATAELSRSVDTRRRMPIVWRLASTAFFALLALLVSTSESHANVGQSATKPPSKSTTEAKSTATPPPRAAVDLALEERDFARAHELIEQRIASGDRDPVMLYNDACALAQLGRHKAAEERLLESVRAGFRDFDLMEVDADLEPIRASETYDAILEAASQAGATGRSRSTTDAPKGREERGRSRSGGRDAVPDPLDTWKSRHGDAYRYERDQERGLSYATFLEPSSHDRMKELLSKLEEHLRSAYFGKSPDTPVLVAIVRPEHAREYLEREEIKGMYLHRARRLVARDVGQSLTHEFVHLMHFAHMERTGQRHPIWVQEGIASLYEAYELRPNGKVTFQPNVRFNIARKQVLAKSAKPWKELMSMPAEGFMKEAEQLYPQVRSMFEFFAREGKLESLYKALCATNASDPDGSSAIERTFGEPLAKVEDRWKRWMVDRGAVDDTVARKDASLGISVEDAGDGVRVRSFVIDSAAKAAGLRVGDVILQIGRTAVRNREELVLAIAQLEIGVRVDVTYRRDGVERLASVTPRPLGG